MVDELLQSPKLATIWDNANATLHTKFVQVMQGEDPGKLHTLNVDLSAAVAQVKQKLEAIRGGLGVATFPMCRWSSTSPATPNVQRVAGYYDLLVTLGTWLPILAILLLLISIVIAPSRLGGLSKAAGWLAVSMVVLTLVLIIGRQWLISKSPLQPDVTQAFTRQLTVNLQDTIRFIVVVGGGDLGGRLAVRAVEERGRAARRGHGAGRSGARLPLASGPSGRSRRSSPIALRPGAAQPGEPGRAVGGAAGAAGRARGDRRGQSAADR